MNKFKSAVLYEFSIKIKAIGIFYLIQYMVVAFIFALIALFTDENEVGSNALEVSTIIFLSIVGVLGYKEDFKALIQNGYTRKYIYLSTVCMFILMSATMALIDTVIGNTLHHFRVGYFTLYGGLYGYGNLLGNWIYLAVLYFMCCNLAYFAVLVINKVGKLVSLFMGVGLGGLVLIVIALFRFVLSSQVVHSVGEFMMKAMGFVGQGIVDILNPVLFFLVIGAMFGICSYAVIRRTELK